MTKKEAIKRIQEHMIIHAEKEPRAIYITDALQIAIKALEQEPCEDTVSRNAIIQKLNTIDRYVSEELRLCDTDKKFPKNEVFIVDDVYEEIVENLPSAQPEIVRCKDCKHRASYWGNCRLLEEKYHQSVLVDGNSFCSMAERRTDELGDK